MGQVTNGIRSILSNPRIYSIFQSIMGAHRARQNFASRYIAPFPGMKVLDIGCGPGDMLGYLPLYIEYWGFDVSESYISMARRKFGGRGHFFCKELVPDDLERLPTFDAVLAQGLLHHLDDATASKVMRLAAKALSPGGRFISVDPCFDSSQNCIARTLISNDRGQNVRTREGYAMLARDVFPKISVEVRNQTWIPYTHCFMVGTKHV